MAVLPTGIGPVTGYNIERSLRFNSADSAHLSRSAYSVASAGTQWTLSMWVKRSALNQDDLFTFVATTGAAQQAGIQFDANNNIRWWQYAPSTYQFQKITTAVFRDVSAWYHLVFYYDTTLATAEDRLQIWVNGVRQTAFSTNTNPSQNLVTYYKTGQLYPYIGAENRNNAYLGGTGLDGYMTEVNFIDGQALTPSSFGETDANTGVWKPKAYTGTYGTNGFFLKFADNSNTTAATLGKDSSGNGNNWTPNNFSVTAGAGNDSLVDTPTNYGSDTGVGGEVRGNYCVLNPIVTGNVITPLNGNLNTSLATGANAYFNTVGTTAISSGKWYWECTVTARDAGAGQWMQFGIVATTTTYTSNALGLSGNMSNGYAYYNDGSKGGQGTSTAGYGATFTTNDVIGIALDLDAGTITFYKNGVSQGQAFSGISLTTSWLPIIQMYRSTGTTQSAFINFGQRAFEKWNGSAYVANTAPSGFKALCTQNLPTPTIGATSTTQANDYFNAVLYTGTGSSQGITGVGFQPDWVWIKERSGAADHGLYDAVRGVQKQIESNRNDTSESTQTTGLTAFNSDGFTVGSLAQLNTNTDTYVAWNWKANGAGGSNTAGTISSTVSANTTSGFSVVTYTGNGSSGATIGHGLGVTPSMIMIRVRNSDQFSWGVYHASVGNTAGLYLNLTNAAATTSVFWNNTSPTSSVFSVGNWGGVNGNTSTYVAYCFAPVAGYSAFGSYTGNGSADGPFVYTGFRPRFVLIKRTDGGSENWWILDTSRDPYNTLGNALFPNTSNSEGAGYTFDFLSNGFKIRTYINTSGATYIYAAFAESPFKYSLAR
jgi:hypothetical protein